MQYSLYKLSIKHVKYKLYIYIRLIFLQLKLYIYIYIYIYMCVYVYDVHCTCTYMLYTAIMHNAQYTIMQVALCLCIVGA